MKKIVFLCIAELDLDNEADLKAMWEITKKATRSITIPFTEDKKLLKEQLTNAKLRL